MRQKILIVDDEISICELLKISLEAEGYETTSAHCGTEALEKLKLFEPDLLILDLMLPEISGFDICKKVTSELFIPIIMLTAKSDLVDKVLGLELGADDYITKPFHTRELIARVKALLRRVSQDTKVVAPTFLSNGDLSIHPITRRVVRNDCELSLSAKEFDLLFFFANHVDQVFSRDALLEKVWGYDYTGDTRTVDVHIQRLRRKIDDPNGALIQTVFGIGYRMKKQTP